MKGKISRIPFKSHFNQTTQPLEVVHANLVGPITPSTNAGKQYFITIVNQHTGFISVTLLARKSNETKAILDFKEFFETQTKCTMKKLITNGGGEFCNKSLLDTLKSHSIQHNVAPRILPSTMEWLSKPTKP
jgi:hypothetical protein